MSEVGRPTDLTAEVFAKIKEAVFESKNLGEIADFCEVPRSTFYTWHSDNYLNLADKIEGWRRDKKLQLADGNIDAILALGISDKDSLKVVADMSKFVKETLDKPNYSKRSEMTGAEGKDLQIQIVNYADTNKLSAQGVSTTPPASNG